MSLTATQTAQVVSIRFASDMLSRLDKAAICRKCTRSEVIKDAVAGYLDNFVWFEKAIDQGLDDLRADRTVALGAEVNNAHRGAQ